MPDLKKNARGKNRTGGTAAGKPADAPLLGEAALKAALAGFGVSPSTNGHVARPAESRGQAEPAPKTVAQCWARSPG
jgi:hypothetical protein